MKRPYGVCQKRSLYASILLRRHVSFEQVDVIQEDEYMARKLLPQESLHHDSANLGEVNGCRWSKGELDALLLRNPSLEPRNELGQ
jgi:hypothetical protein